MRSLGVALSRGSAVRRVGALADTNARILGADLIPLEAQGFDKFGMPRDSH